MLPDVKHISTNDFLCGVWAEAPGPSSAAFFHWPQDTWLAPKCEIAGFVSLNERAHTFPFATLLALTRSEQMALHLPPPCQPTPWTKHKEDSHSSLMQENTRGDKVGITVKNPLAELVLHLLYN